MALMLSLTTGFIVSFVVATIVNVIIGAIWFARPVFGRRYMTALGRTEAQMQGAGRGIAAAFFVNLLVAAFLAFFLQELGAKTAVDGAIIGFLIWLGFVVTTAAPSVFFEKRPVAVFGLTNAYTFVGFIVMGAIIPLVQSYIM